jgi:hyperosmotically inducible periplasmic protein
MMTSRILKCLVAAALVSPLVGAGHAQAPSSTWADADTTRIVNAVQKKLAGITTYSVFDDLHFAIRGKTLILSGSASRPTLKSDAASAVKGIPGVESVDNQIEVLPNSPNDDRLRRAVYNAVYSGPGLGKYNANAGRAGTSIATRAGGITADPPSGFHAIHIIVKNGDVTLRGAVLNAGDANIAQIRANGVPGVFSVTNELGLERPTRAAK